MPILDQFILLGDSITEGSYDQERGFAFAPALQHEYRLKLDVINRGFSGYTTTDILRILPTSFPTPSEAKVRFLTIFLGANDAVLPPASSNPGHVPLAQYITNLRALLSHPLITAHLPCPHILLLTPPPVEETLMARNDAKWGETRTRRLQRNTARYAEAVRMVGQETGTAVVDIWTAFMGRAGWKLGDGDETMPGTKEGGVSQALAALLVDGLHFTPEGYKVMYEGVLKTIEKNWPEETSDKLPSLRGDS